MTDAETDFINSIDCNLPYYDKEACLHLIDEAAGISAKAMFKVIEEICRIPASHKDKIATAFLLELLTQTNAKFNHPLKDMVLDNAFKKIQRQELSVDEAIAGMQEIRNDKGQYAALNIVYFSCGDTEERLEPLHDRIIAEWNKTVI